MLKMTKKNTVRYYTQTVKNKPRK